MENVSLWQQLEAVMPEEQREQLAKLMLALYRAGYGELAIRFEDRHVKGFRRVDDMPAIRPAERATAVAKTLE